MRKKHKTGITDIIFYAISGFVFILLALSCFYPFYYVVINSISENSKVLTGQIRWFPVGIHFNNYVDMLKIKGLVGVAKATAYVDGEVCTEAELTFVVQ